MVAMTTAKKKKEKKEKQKKNRTDGNVKRYRGTGARWGERWG